MRGGGSILLALTWCCLLLPLCSPQENKSLLSVEEGDGGSGDPVIKEIQNVNYRVSPDDTEASGDDGDDPDIDVISGDGSGNGEGSGSGEYVIVNGTIGPPSIKIYTPVKTTATVETINEERNQTATKRTKTTKERVTTSKLTDDIKSTTFEVIDKKQVARGDDNETVTPITPELDDPVPSTGVDEDDNSGVNFTVAIIVGVVVGAVLSILIIVFLVYRLRKKDEGSYSLDEPSSAMLRNDSDSPPPKGK